MPSSKPRVNLTLDPEAFATLSRLAKAAKLPRARILADLLEEALPLLERTATMLEAAGALSAEARAGLRLRVDALDSQASEGAAVVFDALAKAETAIKKAGGDGRRGARSAPTGGRNRPPSSPV
jgi:hypothetical protein